MCFFFLISSNVSLLNFWRSFREANICTLMLPKTIPIYIGAKRLHAVASSPGFPYIISFFLLPAPFSHCSHLANGGGRRLFFSLSEQRCHCLHPPPPPPPPSPFRSFWRRRQPFSLPEKKEKWPFFLFFSGRGNEVGRRSKEERRGGHYGVTKWLYEAEETREEKNLLFHGTPWDNDAES